MRNRLQLVLLFVFFLFYAFSQEILLPISSFNKDKIILLTNELNQRPFFGNGIFPISENEIKNYNLTFDDSISKYKWLRRKLFHEHFFQIKGVDYSLNFDPLVNISLGREKGTFENSLLQNTRSFQVYGDVNNKISFYTAFFENQARFSSFETDYYKSRGELRIVNGNYVQENAVIPGSGRTKPFGDNGFDYASAMSYLRIKANDLLAIQFGNNQNFIGWGHRSLLLSDNSFNATALRIDFTYKKFNYHILKAKHLNLWRRAYTTAVEMPYEKKNYTAHYLTYRPIPNLSLGVFESTIFYREDSVFSQWMHPLYFNPLIGLNSLVFGWENFHAKNLLGLNLAYQLGKKHLLFSQIITDQIGSEGAYGFQIGWRSRDLFTIKNFNLHLEYNQTSNKLYSAKNKRLAYTHFNLPLAHSLGNGFQEFILRMSYSINRFYFQVQLMAYLKNQRMTNNSDLFESRKIVYDLNEQNVARLDSEFGYLINPKTHLSIFSKMTIRKIENQIEGVSKNGILMVGLKSNLFNQYNDF